MMTSGSSGSSSGSSSTVAFAAGAFAGAALSAASLWYYYRSQQPAANRLLPAAVAASSQPAAHTASLRDFESDEILAEHLTRNVQFFGIEKQKQIANAFVVVVGLGVSSATLAQLAVVQCLP
jgi:hypothetical protein